jgi:O-acetylserine/cysteine efflux transporter
MSLIHQTAALLVTFIWGTNFVLLRYALDELAPFTLAALRFLFVAFPLVFFLPKPKTAWKYIVGYGLLIGVGQFGLLFWAMQEDITPGVASLLIQLQVFFTVLLTVLNLKESVSRLQLGCDDYRLSGSACGFFKYERSNNSAWRDHCIDCRVELGKW